MRSFFCFFCFVIISAYISLSCQNKAVAVTEKPKTIDSLKNIKDTIQITAVGDIMLGSAFPSKLNLPPDDAIKSFAAVDSFLKGDIIFWKLGRLLFKFRQFGQM